MNDTAPFRLSVLDTVPVFHGVPAARSLRELLELAPEVERLGYHRYWLAEHHNMPAFGTSTPPVLIGQLAGVTSTLRIGSGGVMLPNHVPYVVAEQFATLEVFHPGRIDLGVGRAPGGEPATARALRRTGDPAHEGAFGEQLAELIGYLSPSAADARPPVAVCPPVENPLPVWLLGTSASSASLAARLGLPYAFAHHLNPSGTEAAVARYREEFRPSERLERPYVAVSAQVVVADTDEEAEYQAGPIKVAHVEGRINPLTLFRTPEQAAGYPLTEGHRRYLEGHFAPQIVGGPETARRRLADFRSRTGADELLATAPVFGLEARVRTFRLLAEAVDQTAATGAGELSPASSASSS
ncbi:LLM class flavin-dependent oxidoreductase [Streptomyces sp. NPDC020472]|uniref:LLM class flavin-dependent oxidoreductase n=1 Tax=unclassified Streptomyces TaxID=2593676 RepID=UPI00369197D7